MKKMTLGLDIGGTTFSSSLFDSELKVLASSDRLYVRDFRDKSELIGAICGQIQRLRDTQSSYELTGLGVSSPGPLDSSRGMILDTPNLKLLQNTSLKKEIESRTGIETHIDNDANLFSLGEWSLSGGNRKEIFSGVTLGTGLGFGLILNGGVYRGAHGLATEYAISPIDGGNWENMVSIRAVSELSEKYFPNQNLSPKDISQMALSGNTDAKSIWDEFGANLGTALCHFINMIDPSRISIGGGISNAFSLFEEKMRSRLSDMCPAYSSHNIEIYESSQKELSAQLGAAIHAKSCH